MSLWIGETWACEECDSVNAVIRVRCRICKAAKRERHPDEAIEAEIQADIHEAAAINRSLRL